MNKRIKNTIKELGGLGLLLTSLSENSNDISLKQYFPKQRDNYQEISAKYTLPKDIKVHTFLNNNTKGDYFGKTTLNKKIGDSDCSIKSQIIHANEFKADIGVGVSCSKKFDNGVFANISILPVWESNNDKVQTQYFIKKDNILGEEGILSGINFSSFGEWDKEGKFGYGEMSLLKSNKINENLNFSYGLNSGLIGEGKFIPKLDIGLLAQFNIKF